MPAVSVLDLSPVLASGGEAQAVRDSVELARAADRFGYHRYWLAEHHGGRMLASSSPEILIDRIASATERMRVGSGGIMLPNHTPLHVAEQFKVLAALHPGRIDLGIGRAPGTDQLHALALRRDPEALAADDFPQRLGELLAFSGLAAWPEGHPFAPVEASPRDAELPPLFLLGSSGFSAQLAAQSGLGFAFAAQINPEGAIDALRGYRDRFEPSALLTEPLAILSHNFVCADTDEEAKRLAAPARVAFRGLRTGRPAPLLSIEEAVAADKPVSPPRGGPETMRMIVGAPPVVRELLGELVERSGADELMVMCNAPLDERIHSYELLAEAFQLGADQPAASPATSSST